MEKWCLENLSNLLSNHSDIPNELAKSDTSKIKYWLRFFFIFLLKWSILYCKESLRL